MWDHNGYNTSHPRHHSIAGFDAKTGERQPAFTDTESYDRWLDSGLSYTEFIKNEPPFANQSRNKKPSAKQIKLGNIGLDCRHLNFAPQCTDWYNLAQYGGSGSFLLLWSNLWKLTTVSAIPYYTGQYGKKLIGFGIVTITVGIDDFHRPALKTQQTIQNLIVQADEKLSAFSAQTFAAIADNLWRTGQTLSISTIAMTLLVVLIAIWMASIITRNITNLIVGTKKFSVGFREFRFNSTSNDEFGVLCDSMDELVDSIVNSNKNPLAITDLEHNIIYINDQGLELLGKTLDEVKGKNHTELSLFGKDNAPIPTFLANKRPSIFYHEPSQRHFKSRVSYFADKAGNNIGFLVVADDVTQLIIEQERIERERALLDMVLSASPDLIWYKSVEGIYLAVNPRFGNLVGLTPEEIHGRLDKELLSKELQDHIRDNEREVLEDGVAAYIESRISFADGHEEVLDIVRTPIFGPDKTIRGILGVGRNVTERVNAEIELRHTQRELIKAVTDANEASKSKSEFLARMSHEIRTPMNAIIGMTSITTRKLIEDSPKEELLPHLAQIESSSKHLLGLLNDILDISKIEAGKIELSFEHFDITKLVKDVSSIIVPRCENKSIELIVNLEGFDHKHFVSDILRLRQVLINLLGNAVKFTPELGKIIFTVRLVKHEDGKSLVHFSVADTGIGIAPEKLKNLFMPFEQGGGHITRMYGGTGLGLSISRRITNLLGSEIEVSSVENKGSEFYFSLWIKEYHDTTVTQNNNEDVKIVAGKRILLVDDIDINRVIAIELLSPYKLIIDEASDGTEAVRIFKDSAENYYDLILMDVQMPMMNGYEATKNIRALDRNDAKSTPIIAMTANAFKDDIDRAYQHGMNAHVAKPIDMDKLVDVLKLYIGDDQ